MCRIQGPVADLRKQRGAQISDCPSVGLRLPINVGQKGYIRCDSVNYVCCCDSIGLSAGPSSSLVNYLCP